MPGVPMCRASGGLYPTHEQTMRDHMSARAAPERTGSVTATIPNTTEQGDFIIQAIAVHKTYDMGKFTVPALKGVAP